MRYLARLAVMMMIVGATFASAGIGARVQAATTGGPGTFVAVSVRGSIVLFAADGSGRTVVTRSDLDHGPVVAPNGRAVAFWRGTTSVPATPRRIMIARWNGHGGWRVAPFSVRRAAAAGLQETLAWAPGSKALAWFDGATVQYRRAAGPQRTILRLGPGAPGDRNLAIAFSRDGGTVAATLPPVSTKSFPRTLRLAVRPITASRQRNITLTFRPGVLVGRTGRESAPVPDVLGYTTSQLAPRGHTLQIATVAAGAGRQMTGVFLAPDTGGHARLVQGNGHGLHGIPPFGYGMNGATHFEDAPNGRATVTDPTGGFYVAGEIGPFHIHAPTPRGCVLSQWTWLADSIHLAYVTECIVPGSSPLRFRLTLASISIFGGAPVVLDRIDTVNPYALHLAPGYRCVACG